jgi:hypothetical protein
MLTNSVFSSFVGYHRLLNRSNAMDSTNGAGNYYPYGSHEFTSVF